MVRSRTKPATRAPDTRISQKFRQIWAGICVNPGYGRHTDPGFFVLVLKLRRAASDARGSREAVAAAGGLVRSIAEPLAIPP